MNGELYTLRKLTSIELNGKLRSYNKLAAMQQRHSIPSRGKIRNCDAYSKEDFESILKQEEESVLESPGLKEGDEFIDLKKEKLRKEIEAINKDNQKKDLQIEQLKSELVAYEDAMQYFVARKALESAILRRIFLTNMPIEVTGLDKAKARDKGETYFNEVMAVCNNTIELWQEKYPSSYDLEKRIAAKVKEIFQVVEKVNEDKQATVTGDPSI